MSKDVIEKINTTLESAEEFKSEGAGIIILDLDVYITILKRLAKYENMESVAGRDIMTGEIYTEYPESNKTQYLALLYYHPNK
ncbi:hypothetical protein [Xenorhabdus bovienii]|uniref:hypothetical protein n=1 Tax=Xenorhabdus bovienii TaxID=40576 RepID=UPI0023B3318F|nr:hypothetical protein [Xenorhabdus bovienii]MDE9590190.1 hypothetical protein [Xenorhabdus bovienii]